MWVTKSNWNRHLMAPENLPGRSSSEGAWRCSGPAPARPAPGPRGSQPFTPALLLDFLSCAMSTHSARHTGHAFPAVARPAATSWCVKRGLPSWPGLGPEQRAQEQPPQAAPLGPHPGEPSSGAWGEALAPRRQPAGALLPVSSTWKAPPPPPCLFYLESSFSFKMQAKKTETFLDRTSSLSFLRGSGILSNIYRTVL